MLDVTPFLDCDKNNSISDSSGSACITLCTRCIRCVRSYYPHGLFYIPHGSFTRTNIKRVNRGCSSHARAAHPHGTFSRARLFICDAQPDTRSCARRSFTLRRPMQGYRVACIEAHRVVTRSMWLLWVNRRSSTPERASLLRYFSRQLSALLAIDCTRFSNHQRWSCLAMDLCRVGPRSWSLAPYDSVTGTEDKRFSHLNISSFIEGARSMNISR